MKITFRQVIFTIIFGALIFGFGIWQGHKQCEQKIEQIEQQEKEKMDVDTEKMMQAFPSPKITKLNLSDFSEKEKTVIADAGLRNNLKGFLYPIFYAIRKAEDGKPGCEFGIIHRKAWNTDLKTQAGWAAATIQKNYDRYLKDQGGFPNTYDGFIAYLGARYCPVGADNDPDGLNKNWIPNVTKWVEKIRS
jgi:hypothetical protein